MDRKIQWLDKKTKVTKFINSRLSAVSFSIIHFYWKLKKTLDFLKNIIIYGSVFIS